MKFMKTLTFRHIFIQAFLQYYEYVHKRVDSSSMINFNYNKSGNYNLNIQNWILHREICWTSFLSLDFNELPYADWCDNCFVLGIDIFTRIRQRSIYRYSVNLTTFPVKHCVDKFLVHEPVYLSCDIEIKLSSSSIYFWYILDTP